MADLRNQRLLISSNEFNIITGLVNFDLLWDKIEKRPPANDNPRPVISWNQTKTATSRDTATNS